MTFTPQNIAIIGASGAIGQAFVKLVSEKYPDAMIYAVSQNAHYIPPVQDRVIGYRVDYTSEDSLAKMAQSITQNALLDMVIVTNGVLHDETRNIAPEKSLKDLSAEKFQYVFYRNTIIPALMAKYLLPRLTKEKKSFFAALSARVGSISDNRLGGWYAYRASKSALNMIIKNAALEIKRTHPYAMVVGLHPGTVKSDLSKPFSSNVPEHKLFTPEYAVQKLLDVLENIPPHQTGHCFG